MESRTQNKGRTKRRCMSEMLIQFHAKISENYTNLMSEFLEDALKSESIKRLDKKEIVTYQRRMFSEETFLVMCEIWREQFLKQKPELAREDFRRSHEEDVTCYSIAIQLAPSKRAVAATNSRVTGIVEACVAFGLMKKEEIHARKSIIVPTNALFQFMESLGRLHVDTLESFSGIFRFTSENAEKRGA